MQKTLTLAEFRKAAADFPSTADRRVIELRYDARNGWYKATGIWDGVHIYTSAPSFPALRAAIQRAYGLQSPRRNGSVQREPAPDCPGHAAPDGLCKFAQNRAVKALQIRPISTTRNAFQELPEAISNGLAAFQSTADNAAQCSPDRPPGVDPLRLYADGVKFSQNFR